VTPFSAVINSVRIYWILFKHVTFRDIYHAPTSLKCLYFVNYGFNHGVFLQNMSVWLVWYWLSRNSLCLSCLMVWKERFIFAIFLTLDIQGPIIQKFEPPQSINCEWRFMMTIMSMRWDNVSELRPPTGLLFIPCITYEHGEPWWSDIDRRNLPILPAGGTWRRKWWICPSKNLCSYFEEMFTCRKILPRGAYGFATPLK
jgi:hypothetical protein